MPFSRDKKEYTSDTALIPKGTKTMDMLEVVNHLGPLVMFW
jgi:hypothetical protein